MPEIEKTSACQCWAMGDPLLEDYHDHEWCRIHHDDTYEFEMLCLEGASTGLSWRTILHKRTDYRKVFHSFDIDSCAEMSDLQLNALMSNTNIIHNRNKIYSVRHNARIVKEIQKQWGSFDAYLWHFTDGKQIDGHWHNSEEVPAKSALSIQISSDMKKRGMTYVGPVITYSFMQAVGMVNDHLADCPCHDE